MPLAQVVVPSKFNVINNRINFKKRNPDEAQALEVEFATSVEGAIANHDTDPKCVEVIPPLSITSGMGRKS